MIKKLLLGLAALSFNFGAAQNVNVEAQDIELTKHTLRSDVNFDENNIVLTAFNFSDSHIGFGSNDVVMHRALTKVQQMYDVDILTCAGDITQDGKEEQVELLTKVIESYYDVTEVPFMYCYGNHDTYWSGCMNTQEFYDAFGEKYFALDLDKEKAKTGNRHVVVNGYHFFAIQMRSYGPNNNLIAAGDEAWLRSELDKVTQENPNQYVFVLSHSAPYDTIYGSNDGDNTTEWGASPQLKNILVNYPQVVSLSGHTHYAPNSDRFISSTGGFMSVLTPSLSDFAYDNLGSQEMVDGSLGAAFPDSRTYSFGEFIEIDNAGNLRILRFDFKNDDYVREPVIVKAPQNDLSHLTEFDNDYRKENNNAPTYKEGATITTFYKSETEVQVNYPRFDDDSLIEYYNIKISDLDGNVKYNINTLSPFYKYPNLNKIPETLSFVFKDFKDLSSYIVTIVAVDEWKAISEPLEVRIERDLIADKVKAADLEEKIMELMLEENIDAGFESTIKQIRNTYNSYDYLIRQYVSNYDKFVEIETDFYNEFFTNDDAKHFGLTTEKCYSNAPVPSRGKVEEGKYGGVTFEWELATFNNSLGINQGYNLDDFHICFSNTYFDSEDKGLGFIISDDIQVKYEQGVNLFVYIDFNEGKINYLNGTVAFTFGETELLKYDNIMHTPWEMKINKVNEGLKFTFITIQDSYEVVLENGVLEGLAGLTNFGNAFFTLSPYGSHESCKIDVISIHDGSCYKDIKPNNPNVPGTSASTSIDTPSGDSTGGDNKGCKGVISGTMSILVGGLLCGYFALRKKKLKND